MASPMHGIAGLHIGRTLESTTTHAHTEQHTMTQDVDATGSATATFGFAARGNLSASSSRSSLAGHLTQGFDAAYGDKLAVIEQIRHELSDENIATPGIIVIGAQSAGKSSILARLTGISFPTGAGTCTRSPAVVSVRTDSAVAGFHALVADNARFDQPEECASLRDLHAAIANFTKQLTNRVTQPISEDAIYVRHTRPRGPSMTLIDLPGITHVAQGSADFDIHAVTAGLVRRYMEDENMIALVVVNANDDFGNSEALKIARESDPDGKRTIGVVSKCDLVPDAHSDILQKMRMSRSSDVQLELGFYAVRNRPECDNSGNGSDGDGSTAGGADVDKEEEAFFKSHPLLSQLAADRRGMAALSRKVIQLQGRAVDRFFATARTQLYDRSRDLRAQLGDMKAVPESSAERRIILTDILRAVHDRIEGLLRTDNVQTPELNVLTRAVEYCEQFVKDVNGGLPLLLGEEYTRKIAHNFKESRGRVLPDVTVDSLIHQVIEELLLDELLPGMTARLIEKHESLMTRVYDTVIATSTDARRFPKLGAFLSSATKDVLIEASHKATSLTTALISAERSASFTLNPVYEELTREMRELVWSMSGQRRMAGAGAFAESNDKRAQAMDDVYPTQGGSGGGSGGGGPSLTVGGSTSQVPGVPLLTVMPRILWQPDADMEELGAFIQRHVSADEPALLRVQFSVHCYAQVVLKRVFDVVPMLVRNEVVFETHRRFHTEIERRLGGKDEELRLAMAEDEGEMRRRGELSERINALQAVYDRVKSM